MHLSRNASRLRSLLHTPPSARPSTSSIPASIGRSSRIGRSEYAVAATTCLLAGGALLYINQPLRLDSSPPEVDPPSEFLFATGGRIRSRGAPAFSRDDVTVVMLIGGPKGGKTEQAKRIAKRFDATYEDASSDIYSDVALALPIAHLSSPTSSSQIRIVVDSPFVTDDPLAEALSFEKHIAPILLFMFIDCPPTDAAKRAPGEDPKLIANEHAEWMRKNAPLIKHYRHQGNFLEITGQWPADEQWEQVEAKLESALELEARGEL